MGSAIKKFIAILFACASPSFAWTQKANDTFTDSDFTAITSHTPNSGSSPWSGYYGGTAAIVYGNALYMYTNGDHIINPTTLNNNQAVEATVGTNGTGTGLLLRAAADNSTYYEIRFFDGLDAIYIYKSGTGYIGNVSATIVPGDTVRAEITGSAIDCYVNGGSSLLHVTDNGGYSSGYAGIAALANGSGVTTVADNFVAYDDSGGAAAAGFNKKLKLLKIDAY